MARYLILVRIDDDPPRWQPYRDVTRDAVGLQLDAAEQFAYGAYIYPGATAVRLEGYGAGAFLWRRDDDGRPHDGQQGRVDACVNGRWWQYCAHAMIHNRGDVDALAEAARRTPGVQAVQSGGPDYQRDIQPETSR